MTLLALAAAFLVGCGPKVPEPLAKEAAQYAYYSGTQEIFEVSGERCTPFSREPMRVEVMHYRPESGTQQLYLDANRSEMVRVVVGEGGRTQSRYPIVWLPHNLHRVSIEEQGDRIVIEGRLQRPLPQRVREQACVFSHWRIEARAVRDRREGLVGQLRYERAVMDYESRQARSALHERDPKAMGQFLGVERAVHDAKEGSIDVRIETLKERSENSRQLFGAASVIDARFRYEYAQTLFERDGPGDLESALLHNAIALLAIRRHLGEKSLQGRLYEANLRPIESRYRADHDLRRYAYLGDVAGMEAALKAGAKIDAAHESGMSALLWAAYGGQAEAARFLIAQGADIEVLSRWGYSPLAYAALSGNEALFQMLIEAGTDATRRYADPAGLNPFEQPELPEASDRYGVDELRQMAAAPASVVAFEPGRFAPEALQAQAAQLIHDRMGARNPTELILKLEKLLLHAHAHGIELDLAALRSQASGQKDWATGRLVNLFRPVQLPSAYGR